MAKEIFNLQRLEQTLENFYKILNIRMSVFGPDEEELLPYPKQAPRFCRCIRRSPALAQGCRVCDKEVMRIARTMTEPYIYTCHAGLTEVYDMGVSEYILVLRMQKAKQLLSDGEHIADVAAACGFSDYNYFFKVFRKRCGMTPKQFQDSARPEE